MKDIFSIGMYKMTTYFKIQDLLKLKYGEYLHITKGNIHLVIVCSRESSKINPTDGDVEQVFNIH